VFRIAGIYIESKINLSCTDDCPMSITNMYSFIYLSLRTSAEELARKLPSVASRSRD